MERAFSIASSMANVLADLLRLPQATKRIQTIFAISILGLHRIIIITMMHRHPTKIYSKNNPPHRNLLNSSLCQERTVSAWMRKAVVRI